MKAEDLVKLRLSKKWSQVHLACFLGVTQATVSRWEHGAPISGPALKIIQSLAKGSESASRPCPVFDSEEGTRR